MKTMSEQIHSILQRRVLPATAVEILAELQKQGAYAETPRKTALADITSNLKKLAKSGKAQSEFSAVGNHQWYDPAPRPKADPTESTAKPKPLPIAPQDRPITIMFSLTPRDAEIWADSLNDLTYWVAPQVADMFRGIETPIRAALKNREAA
jgi:hypothetical protein